MCGIFGSLGVNYKNIGKKFLYDLSHRGPDDSGLFFEHSKSLVLGHNRLSIIDLSKQAKQPMIDDSKTHVIIFNGEIYNYKEIRNELTLLGNTFKTLSDTEVVLKSFIQWGEFCLEKFRGMFAFCIYDKKNDNLFLARDRFGIKPLIYSFLEDQFIFSSELKPFLNSNFIIKKLSIKALSEYFRYGSVKQPSTMLEGVYYLLPGHYMIVGLDKSYNIKKYYDYVKESQKLPKINNYQDAIKKVRQELEISTNYHMNSDVDVGAFLSGGVDSTTVVALMKIHTDRIINTFCVGFKNKLNIEDETEIAFNTATKLGCNHQNIKIDDEYIKNIFDDFIESIDQPSLDGINTFIVSKETSKNMKVALSGLGGDEIFGGYQHFKTIIDKTNKKKTFQIFIGQLIQKFKPNRLTYGYEFVGLDEIVALELQRTINKEVKKILIYSNITPPSSIVSGLSPIQKISKEEIDNYMLNTLLRDNDVLSMAHSLEVRPVLLDHKLVELVFSISDNYKIRPGLLKSLLIDSVKDIIPSEVYNKKKSGFEMPLENWMNEVLNKKFNKILLNPKAKLIFNSDYLKDLQNRAKYKKLKLNDWMSFIFLSWFTRYSIMID